MFACIVGFVGVCSSIWEHPEGQTYISHLPQLPEVNDIHLKPHLVKNNQIVLEINLQHT